MYSKNRFIIGAALSAAAFFALGASADSCTKAKAFRGFFFCNHEDVLTVGEAGPEKLDLILAGAGYATQMQGLVVASSVEYSINLKAPEKEGDPLPLTGEAIIKLRDITGDLIVLECPVRMAPPNADPWAHPFATFEADFTILSAECTGRFAGATGSGRISGWADNDPGTVFESGQSFWDMNGTINLPSKPRVRGKK